MRRWLFLFLLVFCIPLSVFGEQKPALLLSTNTPYQGDVVKIILRNTSYKKAIFRGKQISLFPFNGDLVGFIPISGTEVVRKDTLKITLSDNSIATRTIWVRAKKFPRVSLGIPQGSNLTSATLVKNLQAEKLNLEEVVKKKTDSVFFSEKFQFPLSNSLNISSPFGEIRKTGSAIIRHWGIDYKANEGSDVYAISGGVVVKSYLDTTYGNTIIVDHGQGVFSMYMHLKERMKGEGESVRRGEIIGLVGSTGYSFGPHLHISVKVNGVSVDPEQFIRLMAN